MTSAKEIAANGSTPTAARTREPVPCYECAGSKKITYCTWSDVIGDYVVLLSTCVRCGGAGVIKDGPTARTIHFPKPWIFGPECICNFPTDGPMGNPRCPAR